MPIGDTLAQARQQAGLTVAQVSARTRIRETIIRGIEDDDYSACGGDFYARGHIRAIAKVIGTDSEPLIREYDSARRAPGAVAAVSLQELVATSAQARQRRRPHPPAVWALAVAACASAWRRVNLPAVRGRAAQARRPWGRRANWIAVLGLALVLVAALGVYRLLSGSPHVAVAPSAAAKHAVTGHHARPNPAAKTSHAAVAPPAAPAAPAQPLTPVRVAAFGPGGGDNPQLAHLAIGGHRAAGWHTDWYTSARFGSLYPGTGLLLDMGRSVTVTAAQISLGSARGASLQLRIGPAPALADLPPAAHVSGASGVVRLLLTRPAHGRYVLLWFTRLPADPAGTFQAGVYNVSVQGHP
jgi:helix-turn-helix protein